jgi:hypothetical protein
MSSKTFSALPILAVALAALTAGCSSIEAIMPTGVNVAGPAPTSNGHATQPAGADAEKIKVLPISSDDLDCPEVDIADGGATFRVGGADNNAVRYQFDISNVARQCVPQGGQFALKIGISGQALIGPAGQPGNLSADIKVVVAGAADKKPVFQKSYRVAANTSGGERAPFELDVDPILLPLTRTDLDNLYTITVGFGNSVGSGRVVRKHRPHS